MNHISFRFTICCLVSLFIVLAAQRNPAQAQLTADLILLNGKIWTGNLRQPEAEALARRGNRIVAVGTTTQIRKLAGASTRVIDLSGKRVVPGFNDAHVHFFDGDGRWAESRIGKERAKGTYAFRSLLDAGAVSAFGSDWFVAPLEPLMGIYAAVTRRTLDGKHPNGWVPEQKITVAEAVRAFTYGSAYASFDEKLKGTLEAGKLADLAVLSADIFKLDPLEIAKAKVVLTVVDGSVIYERPTMK